MGLPLTMDPKKLGPFLGVKQEQLSPRSQASQPENLVVQTSQESSVLRGASLGPLSGGSITKGIPSTRPPPESPITYRGSITHGTPAEVLYKGTITRIIGEDSPSRAEKAREDALPKGHVIYEGKKGHVLTYDAGKRQILICRAPLCPPGCLAQIGSFILRPFKLGAFSSSVPFD
ncbi:UNVERIFIED_CONTAM: nuclear receptor corepressor 2 [Gekko kuhli]